MGWSTTVVAPPDGDMGDYMKSLEKLIARKDSILYPTHGSPIVKPARFLRAYLSHRKMRESQIARAIKRGKDTVPLLVETLYAGLAPALVPAAQPHGRGPSSAYGAGQARLCAAGGAL